MDKEEKKEKKEKIPRQKMPEQDPKARVRNFNEVPLGFSPETAMLEAKRCIMCKKPGCVAGCPVDIDIPAFIKLIAGGDFIGAARKLKETNVLPAVCGRVCPQEDQCEKVCILGKKGDPVAIGRLERFAADYERQSGQISIPGKAPSTGKRIAVVGAGPAGLTIAGDLVKMGHDVTIFEALHKSGGVLIYGIPEFRLPKAIVDAEVDYMQKLGVKVVTNFPVGRLKTVDDLFAEGFHAVFLGVGAGAPVFMNIPGENFSGIYSANEYLTRSNLMKAYAFPEYDTPIAVGKNVCVIGGGNVAMDSVRTALRLGAENAYIVYRRTEKEMPARIEEVHHAQEEGVQFKLLTNPIEYLGNEKGWVKGMVCQQMELGEPDESGRRRPVPMKGSEFVIECDTVVVAIGTMANPVLQATTPGLSVNKWGYIVINEETGETSRKGVYAGGDIVTGSATVILAMGAGRKAASAIHNYVMGL
ncbi:MAG TPA: NADPH-dependent glutamate synthase [Syntrophales bacterium]|nr:NADPH-dependent glutamate synthase [Syntrophales bacterium]HPI58353.1 NADPH-dependent glutamate synthase [Syntrophales bacterium]HPN26192.1 NADPH-dependent glutamate synthase [Syntrophales bacterium]HQM30585.1 NADPH-dependent glutamate synthase [Syntrophales bacterium]